MAKGWNEQSKREKMNQRYDCSRSLGIHKEFQLFDYKSDRERKHMEQHCVNVITWSGIGKEIITHISLF